VHKSLLNVILLDRLPDEEDRSPGAPDDEP